MFLKNFFIFKKNKFNLLSLFDFKILNYYIFFNYYYYFILNFYLYNNTLNFFKSIIFNNNQFCKNIYIEDDFRRKKVINKFYVYKNKNNNLLINNQYNLIKYSHKKIFFYKKFGFLKFNYFISITNFYKNKIYFKCLNLNCLKSNFDYVNLFYLNYFFYLYSIFIIKRVFFKSKSFKNIFFYKNIFKTFTLLKNLNNYIINNNFFLLNNNLLSNFNINLVFLKKINYIYNNQYPLIFFKKYKKIIFSKFNLKKKNNFINLFNLFFLNFFEFFFKKNFFLKISNSLQYYHIKKIHLFSQNWINSIKFQKFFDSNEMIEILCITFLYKDLNFFKNWLINTLNLVNVKNHKKLFTIINDFVIDNFSLLTMLFCIKGFYFCIKGKIGVSGNAKKKKFFFKKGLLKVSSKNFKIDNQRFFVKTNCGSLGINIILSY